MSIYARVLPFHLTRRQKKKRKEKRRKKNTYRKIRADRFTGLANSRTARITRATSRCPDAEQVPLRFRAPRAALMHESKISSHLEHCGDGIKARMIAASIRCMRPPYRRDLCNIIFSTILRSNITRGS